MNQRLWTNRARKRFRYHLLLAFASFTLIALVQAILVFSNSSPQSWVFRWSLATGYVGALLLAATLSLGSWKVLSGRANPVSTDLRRDIGIWCGIVSIAHVGFGLNVHLKSWTRYFVSDEGGIRTDFFGIANYTGLTATFVLVLLLLTSNDLSLSLLKNKRWKAIQRWNYFFAFLVAIHALLFIALEKRVVPYSFIFGVILVWTTAIQITGLRKRKYIESITQTQQSRNI